MLGQEERGMTTHVTACAFGRGVGMESSFTVYRTVRPLKGSTGASGHGATSRAGRYYAPCSPRRRASLLGP